MCLCLPTHHILNVKRIFLILLQHRTAATTQHNQQSHWHYEKHITFTFRLLSVITITTPIIIDIINPTITLTDDVTAIDDDASGYKPPVIDLMIIDDTISSNHYIRINDSVGVLAVVVEWIVTNLLE